jgi:hypothetical protein
MRKIMIIGLMLVVSGTAYSNGKEYSYSNCNKVTGGFSGFVNEISTCEQCKLLNKTISFKISKTQDSVMTIVTDKDGHKTYTDKGTDFNNESIILYSTDSSCGKEIKNISNFFK